MSRIDVLRGGITGVKKMAAVCEAFGVKCEIHMSGFGNLQVLGSTSEDVCEYYERGLLAPGVDYETPPPYLEAIADPMDDSARATMCSSFPSTICRTRRLKASRTIFAARWHCRIRTVVCNLARIWT